VGPTRLGIRPAEERFLQMNSAKESAVGISLPFGKETVALILWDSAG
jgi:hypothetical protein